ncbi:MAG: hypothetical protein GY898_28340 [Proteobacteria bacterium]|nr:hypothetical protein [Pseudomonadota bacterium]
MISKLAALGCGLVLATGCAPERPDAQPGTEGTQRLAVVSSGTGGGAEIVIMNADSGRELDRIQTDLGSWTTGLARHPDGFFLVGQGSSIFAIDDNGDRWLFNDEMWGGIHGIAITNSDEITVGNAEDGVTKLDDDGEIIMHSQMGGTCFMDSAGDASIDIYGPRIAIADSDSGTLETIATDLGYNTGHLAVDGGGRYYAGSYYDGDDVYLVEDGDSEHLGSLTEMGIDGASYINAMTGASNNSAYVLYDGINGSGIAEVKASGNASEVVIAEGEVWTDLVVF